jgi:hypothetical protein
LICSNAWFVAHDAQQHIAEINANPDATQEERQAAIEKVNAAVAINDI